MCLLISLGCMQDVKATDTLWTVAKEATAHVKSENNDKGGLAFWSRMYADKTMFEAMGQETPSFNPPFTVSHPPYPSGNIGPVFVQHQERCTWLCTCVLTCQEDATGQDTPCYNTPMQCMCP